MIIFLSILFAVIAGLSKSLQDICSESNFYNSKLITKFKFNIDFWYKSISSKNKWKNGDKSQGEKFWGSSTIFVMFTDGWHLMDSSRTLFSFLSGGLATLCFPWFYSIPVVITIMLIVFETSYSFLKK